MLFALHQQPPSSPDLTDDCRQIVLLLLPCPKCCSGHISQYAPNRRGQALSRAVPRPATPTLATSAPRRVRQPAPRPPPAGPYTRGPSTLGTRYNAQCRHCGRWGGGGGPSPRRNAAAALTPSSRSGQHTVGTASAAAGAGWLDGPADVHGTTECDHLGGLGTRAAVVRALRSCGYLLSGSHYVPTTVCTYVLVDGSYCVPVAAMHRYYVVCTGTYE
jgi:hypothetical protein